MYRYEYVMSTSDPINLMQGLDHGNPVLHHIDASVRRADADKRERDLKEGRKPERGAWMKHAEAAWTPFAVHGADQNGQKVFRGHFASGAFYVTVVAARQAVDSMTVEELVEKAVADSLPRALTLETAAYDQLTHGWMNVFGVRVLSPNMMLVNTGSVLRRFREDSVRRGELGDFHAKDSTDRKFRRAFPEAEGFVIIGGFKIPVSMAEYRSGSMRIQAHKNFAIDCELVVNRQMVDTARIRIRIVEFLASVTVVEPKWLVHEEDEVEVKKVIGDVPVEVF